ncbi:putative adrenodoxin-like protein, mitochondrial-like [Apostichopus japonicus]|uniref:Putative adrenodoxin-like protein, mitochondrial-like n=1 Tax=Stichopus japonicus TaxID=307972 RepID=A0A2G8JYZ2_STIJA|nr:putative adrenodoxin-like protein, mitochondrial-like [Apostichopus japonicus]
MAAPMRRVACRSFLAFSLRLHQNTTFKNFKSLASFKLPSATNFCRRIHVSKAGGLKNGEFEMQDPKSEEDVVNIVYIDRDDIRHEIKGKVGDNVMYLAHRYDIDIEGACEASLACCTCHVVLPDNFYDKLSEPTEEEEDMLDLAPFLTATSRLGCQVILTKELEGMEVRLPQATRNFYVDGHVPEPH